jgi:protein SCO1/2
MRRIAITLAAVAGVVGIVGCGESSSSSDQPSSDDAPQASTTASYAGATANPSKPAPPLKLEDSRGETVNLDDYRGKAVLVTFLYTNCPDICPTIVSNLRAAQNELGPQAEDMQIIAVSVDPKRDTPKTVNAFLKDRLMTGRMEYLIGSEAELGKVWTTWNIRERKDPKSPELLEHSALIYGISGSGEITTLYPSNFKPQQIVHDVPKLAAS